MSANDINAKENDIEKSVKNLKENIKQLKGNSSVEYISPAFSNGFLNHKAKLQELKLLHLLQDYKT